MKNFFSRYILFVYGLPVFFVLHGFNENYDLVPVKPAAGLIFWYVLASTVFVLIFWRVFKNPVKAGLMTLCIMGYQFFFGSIQDALNKYFQNSFLVKYSFLLGASLAGFIIIFILLIRSNRKFLRTTLYLNILLGLLIALDAGLLLLKIAGNRSFMIVPEEKFTSCDSCATPDIYLIIADAYPGKSQFKNILGYDNSPFEEALKLRGFHIADSSLSNYNFTFFSMGSLLNLNYLNTISGSIQNKQNIPAGRKALKDNLLIKFLEKQGYHFYNYSVFDFTKNPTMSKPTFWINDTRPITRQTFLSRLNRDLGYHLVTTFKLKAINSYPPDQDLKNNELLFAETLKTIKKPSVEPKFVYTHLMMPHHPYYFDSTGKRTPPENLTKEYAFDKKAALSYIVYANKKYLELIDTILAHSSKPPVILLISDHGFREIKEDRNKNTMFLNLNAVLFPGKDYTGFYKGMSNVNLFRLFLNTHFQQRLPLLKDSTVLLED